MYYKLGVLFRWSRDETIFPSLLTVDNVLIERQILPQKLGPLVKILWNNNLDSYYDPFPARGLFASRLPASAKLCLRYICLDGSLVSLHLTEQYSQSSFFWNNLQIIITISPQKLISTLIANKIFFFFAISLGIVPNTKNGVMKTGECRFPCM